MAQPDVVHVDRAALVFRLSLPPRWSRSAVWATLLAAVLSVVWARWLARDAGDLAAQYAWTGFVRHHPGSAYDLSWYGGIHPASYSLISPYLMAWIGVRTTGVIAATAGALFGALLLMRSGIARPLMPAMWFAVAVWCNLVSGRVTYLLGITFALLATVLVMDSTGQRRPRPAIAAVLGVVATMCSPVAGLFIEVLGAALLLTGRRRHAYLLAPGPPLVIGATTLLFPFSGVQPFSLDSALPTLSAAVAVAVLVPLRWRTVRTGAWIYVLGVALCWALPTPIGSNVERLIQLAGVTILVCAGAVRGRPVWAKTAAYAAAAALAAWTIVQPIADVINTAPVTATVADARPLIAELMHLDAEQERVEVVPLRSHWEASGLAPYLDLARGWNRQADVARNPLFYNGRLTPTAYHTWLRDWSVGYVVLPSDELDTAGIAEKKIITTGYQWLQPVWQDTEWQVFRVEGTDPLATAPATVTYAGPAALTVDMPRAGSVVLRIVWSPWLAIDGVKNDDPAPHSCLTKLGAWTELTTPIAGTFTIEARYTLDRGTRCPVARPG